MGRQNFNEEWELQSTVCRAYRAIQGIVWAAAAPLLTDAAVYDRLSIVNNEVVRKCVVATNCPESLRVKLVPTGATSSVT